MIANCMAPLLVCPACRTRTPDGARLDVRTLDRAGDLLVCACGRSYPVIDGVPILMADPGAYLHREMTTVVERDLAPEIAALLVERVPDDATYARHLEHLSTYLDTHWGDRATPPPDGPSPAFGAAALVERIAALAHDRVPTAIELGCSTGRIVAELARGADHVVGLDLRFGSVRRARHLLDGEPLPYARRAAGRHYTPAVATAGDLAVPAARRTLVCSNALDPPVLPASFERVVALNLIDSVAHPRQLLLVMDGLCAPGGELVLSSPYAWQSEIMDERERIGRGDPAADVTAILREGRDLGSRYEIVDEAELPWTLRRDARSAATYRIHYLRAKKR
jgi:uncharacterized protein YbaR (Trm112 family)